MAFLIIDEVLGHTVRIGELRAPTPRMTVRELIRARVDLLREEWLRAGAATSVSAAPQEGILNGQRAARGFGTTLSDLNATPEALQAEAEAAFKKGRFVLLVGSHQASDLDEAVEIADTGEVTFLLLTPLQGG